MKSENVNVINTPSPVLQTSSPSRARGTTAMLFPTRGKVGEARKREKANGFTLIELLVAVLIIGILAAVALPQYQKAVYKSRYSILKQLVKSVATAQEAYYLANGTYSLDLDTLDISFPTSTVDHEYEDGEDAVALRKRARYWEWGNCWINTREVSCVNNQIPLQYKIYLQHDDNSYAGKHWCMVPNITDINDMRHKICQEETHKDTPTCCGNSYIYP